MERMLLKNGERKVSYDIWRDAVIREGMKAKAVRTFAELLGKDSLTVFYLDGNEVLRRRIRLKLIIDPPGSAPMGSVWMFDGFLRTGDVIDVGDGGTLWDSTIRYGLVCEFSEVLWLDGGNGEIVLEALVKLDRTAHRVYLKRNYVMEGE